jgi:dienelactone hydrolase
MKEYGATGIRDRGVGIPTDSTTFEGMLSIPLSGTGIVLFAFGGVDGRLRLFNERLVQTIREAGIGTLVMNLLTQAESRSKQTEYLRFDIKLLAKRLMNATAWLAREAATRHLRPCYFASGTASAAALVAAAELGNKIAAVASCGGWPDLADQALTHVKSPTLLITAGREESEIELNKQAFARLQSEKRIEIVQGATHFFAEPEAVDRAASVTLEWFLRYLPAQRPED